MLFTNTRASACISDLNNSDIFVHSQICRDKIMSLGLCKTVEDLPEREGDGGGWDVPAHVLKEKREKFLWQIKIRYVECSDYVRYEAR